VANRARTPALTMVVFPLATFGQASGCDRGRSMIA
jgi:hypothetical protein